MFNPVPKMELVELAFPPAASEQTRERARALCEALGKTAVEVPDTAGFVVNRLLFPYLFEAVRLMERTGLEPEAIDTCMRLGAGHPLGPLALLDLVGLDVAAAIGRSIGAEVPVDRADDRRGRARPEGRPRLLRVRRLSARGGAASLQRARRRPGPSRRSGRRAALVRGYARVHPRHQLLAVDLAAGDDDRHRHLAAALVGRPTTAQSATAG